MSPDRGSETKVRSLDQFKPSPHVRLFDSPKTVLLGLDEGEEVAPHRHPDENVVLHVVEGEMEVELDGTPHVVEENEVIRFDGGSEVSPLARTGSKAVLVFEEK
ncbi:MAG: cupin domain-containing protein [Halobacteria archaeon]|nr:cupin domain-containing protein [Halobacteria archaeon]